MKSIDQCIKKELVYWPLWFHNYMFEYEDNEVSKETKESIAFICDKLSFGYEDTYSNNYRPSIVMGGKRSVVYNDLSDQDFLTIERITKSTTNVFVLAKCYEILFIKTQNQNHCKLSVDSFIKSADLFISNDKTFASLDFIRHALFLLKSIKDNTSINSLVDEYIFNTSYKEIEDCVRVINSVFDFFTKCNYSKYDKKKLVDYSETLSITDSDFSLELIKNIFDYYSSIHDDAKQNEWQNKYADMCERLCQSISPRGYKYINLAIDFLSKPATLNEERINELRFKLEEEQKKYFDTIQFQSVPLDNKVNEEINKHINDAINLIKNEKNSVRQLLRFLEIFKPVKEKELNDFVSGMEGSVFEGLFNHVIFDKDKKIVEEIGPDDVDKRRKQNIVQAYHLFHAIYFPIAMGFADFVEVDEELENLIAEIISHNEFVPQTRIEIVKNYVILGLKKDIRKATYLLISQFEYGCVNYLKDRKKIYPTITKGTMTVKIDLNHILTNNKFRKKIVEILGEDLTKELQFLLVEKRYGNLRNQDYHEGLEREDVFTNFEVLAFYRLLNAYCLGYDKKLN